MRGWKPWQLVFLAYLLVLNVIVFCVLAFFLVNRGYLFLGQTPSVASVPPQPVEFSPEATAISPAEPAPLTTPASTEAPSVIPSVNIPPVLPSDQPQPTPTALPATVALATPIAQVPTATATPQPTPTKTATATPTPTPR